VAARKLAVEAGDSDAYSLSASREDLQRLSIQARAPSTGNNVPGTDTNELLIERSGLNSCTHAAARTATTQCRLSAPNERLNWQSAVRAALSATIGGFGHEKMLVAARSAGG
jgi:hypothetical protein